MKTNILKDKELERFRKKNELQPYRIKQINHQIFKNSVIDFNEMKNLSKDLREELSENFGILPFEVEKVNDWEETTKIAFRTKDWQIIESVIIYHYNKYNNPEKDKINRITLCISTQIWCTVWCKFCVTWKLWFTRNLEYEEIVWQMIYANYFVKNKLWKKKDKTYYRIRNVVYMGMWEPLLNYKNTSRSIETLIDDHFFNLSKRHITISTSWIIPVIKNLIKDWITVKLAVSLHAPNQELREKLIPIAKYHQLQELMETLDYYVEKTDNRIFYEYIMIKGITDDLKLAEELADLLKWRLAHVNLIPFNENPKIDYKESDINQIRKFKSTLEQRGITVTIRDSLWRDFKSSCWQLWYEIINK